jgi:2'-phosphotransferase
MADDSLDGKVEIAELSLSNRGERSGRERGRGGRSTGGRPGRGREVEISKALSKLLRHAAVEEGLELDAEGFAKMDQVVSGPRHVFSILLRWCDFPV